MFNSDLAMNRNEATGSESDRAWGVTLSVCCSGEIMAMEIRGMDINSGADGFKKKKGGVWN